MTITTVISDLGNVLVNYDNDKACRLLGYALDVEPESIRKALFVGNPYLNAVYSRGEIDTDEFARRLRAAAGAPPAEDEGIDRILLRRLFCDVFTWNIEVQALYILLKRRGLQMTALSNVEPIRWEWLEKMGVADMFDRHLVSFREGLLKPSEELMVRALDRSGCKAEDAVFIDDLAPNLVPAAALGINTVHFRDHAHLVADLRRLGLPIDD